jgi:hypothetical protein
MTRRKSKILKFWNTKPKTFRIHKSKTTPPFPRFTPKKENEYPQNDKKKIKDFKLKRNKKPPKVHKMIFFRKKTSYKKIDGQNEIQTPHPHVGKNKWKPPKWKENNWKLLNFKKTKLKIFHVHKIKVKDPQTWH